MRTVIVGKRPPELEDLIERRHALGQDAFDEVWRGEYHVAPGPSAQHARVTYELTALLGPLSKRAGLVGTGPFNLGEPSDYRVPDGGFHRERPTGVYLAGAAVVLEVVSPDDETYDKFEFYAQHDVAEIIVAEPVLRVVRIWQLTGDGYAESARSEVLDVDAAALSRDIDWS